MTSTFRRSPLALAVLGLLEAGPMHPYAIQRRIKEWGKDQVINVGQRASLYKVITRLAEAGLVVAKDTERDHNYPERTTYEITDAGREAAVQWLGEILSAPRNEFPEFPAALSFLPMLTPDTTRDLLAQRRDQLTQQLASLDADLASEIDGFQLPRVVLLDNEFQRTITAAELNWVTGVLAELADGSLSWDREQLKAFAAEHNA